MYQLCKDKYFLVPGCVIVDFLPLLNFKRKQKYYPEMIEKIINMAEIDLNIDHMFFEKMI